MTDEIRLVYADAEEMSRIFKGGAQHLESTNQEMLALAAMMEGGALLGRGGDAFKEAIRDKLSQAIKRLTAKFTELDIDVQLAIADMREADESARDGMG
jgi:hypothetical protein